MSLQEALWQATGFFSDAPARAGKRVIVFTTLDNPAGDDDGARHILCTLISIAFPLPNAPAIGECMAVKETCACHSRHFPGEALKFFWAACEVCRVRNPSKVLREVGVCPISLIQVVLDLLGRFWTLPESCVAQISLCRERLFLCRAFWWSHIERDQET